MNNEFELKDVVISLIDKSDLNLQQIKNTIKELADYYNMDESDFEKPTEKDDDVIVNNDLKKSLFDMWIGQE